jgi:hypothetical protein
VQEEGSRTPSWVIHSEKHSRTKRGDRHAPVPDANSLAIS